MNEHDTGLLQFLTEPQKRRAKALLELGRRRRDRFRSLLDHDLQIDSAYSERLEGPEQTRDAIIRRLRANGAGSKCYVISANSELDQLEMELSHAVDAVIKSMSGGVVSCIPGRLAYLQYEDAGETYLLAR